jgi:hypothetical protein
MIISASRRTDIPAFYAEWFLNRLKAGTCTVPNPFNHRQASIISLEAAAVDLIVFWTRNPRLLLPRLTELDALGYRYYFQYTLMGNPVWLDPASPPFDISINVFKRLSDIVGPDRIIWRYDPIVFSNVTGAEFHQETYGYIAGALKGYTRRSVISIVDFYKKTEKRLHDLSTQGVTIQAPDQELIEALVTSLAFLARDNGMDIVSCAEEIDLRPYGVRPGKCIDDGYIKAVFGLDVSRRKDPAQRKSCGCVASRDIGMYDSCIYGCQYCYATTSFLRARANHQAHDPLSPSLLAGNL